MPIPRMLHRIYATLNGYFWLPCPICGWMFGGHETAETSLMDSWNTGDCVCRRCGKEAEKRNQEWMASHPVCPVWIGR